MAAARNVRPRAAAIWLLVALTAAAAVALYVAVVRDLPAYTDGFHAPWWALAAGFAATEVFVIHAHVRGSAHTLSLSELPLVAGLLLATPQERATYASERIPLGRAGRADEIAAAYAFLASDDASFVHGEALVIDGGQLAVM